MTSTLRLFVLLLIGGVGILGTAACNTDSARKETTTVPKPHVLPDSLILPFAYDLARPELRLSLSTELKEVSGLTQWADNQIAMVNDELGIIYIYSLTDQEIIRKISFALPGDFEGIEKVGKVAYALRSDGMIFMVNNLENGKPNLETFSTPLSEEDDTEGLGFDPISGHLLIVGKEPSRNKGGTDRWRSIYPYDIQQNELSPTPIDIDLAEIKAILQSTAETEKEKEKAMEFEVEKKKSFKPSALAVHPLTQHYYVLASAGKLLVVLNREGHVIAAKHLRRKIFSQPEGICFAANGDMFISNEGRDGQASLLRFSYQSN